MDSIITSFYTSAGLFWNALWALGLGYAFSAVIQVFISKRQVSRSLSTGSPKELSRAAFFGFISSSCSFAALSGTRNLLIKGAALPSALAYMFASTNLAIEVAALAYIFLGWQYALALFLGAPILIIIQSLLIKVTLRKEWRDQAIQHAEEQLGEDTEMSEDLPSSISKKLRNKTAWHRVGMSYVSEWKMVYKELLIGFLIAGFVATLVPASFFQALFPANLPAWILVPIQAIIAPFISIITIIGSMGNGPLAAVLANNGVVFGALMAFLYADFNVPPAVRINKKFYGWRFALYLAGVTAVSAITAGIAIHLVFTLLSIVPTSAKDIGELSQFEFNYTFWLNLLTLFLAAVLYFLSNRKSS